MKTETILTLDELINDPILFWETLQKQDNLFVSGEKTLVKITLLSESVDHMTVEIKKEKTHLMTRKELTEFIPK